MAVEHDIGVGLAKALQLRAGGQDIAAARLPRRRVHHQDTLAVDPQLVPMRPLGEPTEQGRVDLRPGTRPHLLGNTGGQFFFRLPYAEARLLAADVLEPLGSVWREQERPNDSIDDPLLTPAEEMAWRTRELAALPVGACYWLTKGRPYKGRRIRVLPPLDLPFTEAKLRARINAAMSAYKEGRPLPAPEPELDHALHVAIAERSARREERFRKERVTQP